MHITENKLRIAELNNFSDTFEEYVNNPSPQLRKEVARLSVVMSAYARDAGVGTFVQDNRIGAADIFENILNRSIAPPDMVIDCLHKAIGVYEYRHRQWVRGIINPFFWVGQLIRIPFFILHQAGFNISKIESTWASKTYKVISAFVIFMAALLTALNSVGLDTNFFHHENTKKTQEQRQ